VIAPTIAKRETTIELVIKHILKDGMKPICDYHVVGAPVGVPHGCLHIGYPISLQHPPEIHS
jgi:hypothetical protein